MGKHCRRRPQIIIEIGAFHKENKLPFNRDENFASSHGDGELQGRRR